MARNPTEADRKRNPAITVKRDAVRRKQAQRKPAIVSLLADRVRGAVSPLGGVATARDGDGRWRR